MPECMSVEIGTQTYFMGAFLWGDEKDNRELQKMPLSNWEIKSKASQVFQDRPFVDTRPAIRDKRFHKYSGRSRYQLSKKDHLIV